MLAKINTKRTSGAGTLRSSSAACKISCNEGLVIGGGASDGKVNSIS